MQIVKRNVFTLFNFLNLTIALLLFAVGAYSNMFFITIVILNVVIGTAQELKAKKLVDELSILNQPESNGVSRWKRDNYSCRRCSKRRSDGAGKRIQICNERSSRSDAWKWMNPC